ncbi:hypothetical protein G7Y79_00061g092880 [Physcia stellaris]|nr:hypothetical protein G7Y79_00061g092880 [Physcia stellaris]
MAPPNAPRRFLLRARVLHMPPFCERHKGKEEGVCETNHVSYYRNHPLRWATIFSSLEARENEMEKRGSLVSKKQVERENEEKDRRGNEVPEETGPSNSKP